MAQITMYPAIVNSPNTTLTAGISESDTTIPVTELGVFPAAPNTATIGTGVLAETIYYAGKSAATGAGNLTSVTREWNKTGTYGAKKAWLSGEVIGREFTAYDLDTAKANIEDLASKEAYTEGLLSIPTIAYVDATHISVTTCDCLMRDDAVWGADNILWKKTIAENTNLAVTADSVNYIYVLWSGGTGVYAATTDRETLNWSNCVPVARVAIQTGSITYQLNYGLSAKGSAQKNFDRVMRIRGSGGVEKESGMAISVTEPGDPTPGVCTLNSGYAWFGLRRLTSTDLPTITQGVGGAVSDLWYHTGASTWAKTTATSLNNTQYDKLTAGYGLTTLSAASRYAVNWIFRNLVTLELDIVLGTGDYTSSQAEASLIPTLPPDIQNFYILVGRVIYQKSTSTPYAIENVTTTSFRAASTTVHSDLSNLTYGTSGHTGFAPKEAIVEVTGTTQAMAVNTPYIANNGALVTLTLPATAALGDFVAVEGKGAGGWKIAQNASQYIRFISISSVAGVGGSIASTAQYDVVRLLCTTANNGWTVIYSEGNLSVVTA
ncbi:MAG: hypothetical protein WCX48_08090 [Bacteroidales bacterium]